MAYRCTVCGQAGSLEVRYGASEGGVTRPFPGRAVHDDGGQGRRGGGEGGANVAFKLT
jgi:hypothetical protein